MSAKKLDLTKPLQTSDGRPVRYLGEVRGPNPLVFAIVNHGYNDTVISRGYDGLLDNNREATTIINTPPPKHVRYLNVYRSDISEAWISHDDKASADERATPNRIACIRVEIEEGRFDE